MSPPESRLARLRREMRVSFVLALPLVLSQISSMAMNIVDTVLAGRHGRNARCMQQGGQCVGIKSAA